MCPCSPHSPHFLRWYEGACGVCGMRLSAMLDVFQESTRPGEHFVIRGFRELFDATAPIS